MLNKIPEVIYDKDGNRIRVIKASEVFFNNHGQKGYVLHIEREERVTSISEFDLTEEDGKYIITRDVLKSSHDV